MNLSYESFYLKHLNIGASKLDRESLMATYPSLCKFYPFSKSNPLKTPNLTLL